MKIQCRCGNCIPDITDYLPFKAHIIGDKNYFDFMELVDEAIESKETNREKLCMEVRGAVPTRSAWECNSCGRIYLDDENYQLVEFVPQNGKPNRIFDRPRNKPTG
jgi:hypothetical protein